MSPRAIRRQQIADPFVNAAVAHNCVNRNRWLCSTISTWRSLVSAGWIPRGVAQFERPSRGRPPVTPTPAREDPAAIRGRLRTGPAKRLRFRRGVHGGVSSPFPPNLHLLGFRAPPVPLASVSLSAPAAVTGSDGVGGTLSRTPSLRGRASRAASDGPLDIPSSFLLAESDGGDGVQARPRTRSG